MYSNSPFKYYCYLRFYRHPWLPSYHSTITLCDLIQIHGFSTRIWWWLWLWQVLFLAYLTVQCTSPLNFIGTVNLKSANLNSPSSLPMYVLLLIFHILVDGDISSKSYKLGTRFFLYYSILFSFCLQMLTKTYLLIFLKLPPHSTCRSDSSFLFSSQCASYTLTSEWCF